MSYKKIQEIIQNRERMTNKQKELWDYIITNASDISILSANQLAKNASVGKATFFRFLKDIGYESYLEFRQDIHNYVNANINSNYWQTHALIKKAEDDKENFLYNSIQEATELLGNLMTVGLNESFNKAIDLIQNSEEIAILGCRTSKQVARYFENLLIPLGKKINQISTDEHLIFDKISTMSPNGVLFLIAGWPYSTAIVQAGELANKLGIPIIFLANSISCSISSFADVILLIPKLDNRYTVIPFVAVLEAITNDLFSKNHEIVSINLKKIDRTLNKYKQFTW